MHVIDTFSTTIKNVLEFSMPMVVICVVVAISFRAADIIKNKKNFCFYKELLALAFIVYILCLFQVVTFQDSSLGSGNNLIPFTEMFRYEFGSRLFLKNVLGNIVMFLPFGFFMSYFLKERKLLPILILVVIASLTIETTQLVIGRVFDVDDIILNILGGVLGHYLYVLVLKVGELCPKIFLSELFLNIISIIFVVGLITLI